jgi:nucleotidyltransferase substrate binding protein (TIGR01987 family)
MNGMHEEEVFRRALAALERAQEPPPTSERDLAGCIQLFELAFETGWKAIRRRLLELGVRADSPRSVISEAYRAGILADEAGWVEMLRDRNLTTHTYHRELAESMASRINSQHLLRLQEAAIKDQ